MKRLRLYQSCLNRFASPDCSHFWGGANDRCLPLRMRYKKVATLAAVTTTKILQMFYAASMRYEGRFIDAVNEIKASRLDLGFQHSPLKQRC